MKKIFLTLAILMVAACRDLPFIGKALPAPSEAQRNAELAQQRRQAQQNPEDYELNDLSGDGQSLAFFREGKPQMLLAAVKQLLTIENQQFNCDQLQALEIKRASISEDGFQENWYLTACNNRRIYQVLFQSNQQGQLIPSVSLYND